MYGPEWIITKIITRSTFFEFLCFLTTYCYNSNEAILVFGDETFSNLTQLNLFWDPFLVFWSDHMGVQIS